MEKEEQSELLTRIENANKEAKELIARMSELKNQGILGGKSGAGNVPVQISEDTKTKERVNKMLQGTGFKI